MGEQEKMLLFEMGREKVQETKGEGVKNRPGSKVCMNSVLMIS